jgi:hypothetical protein
LLVSDVEALCSDLNVHLQYSRITFDLRETKMALPGVEITITLDDSSDAETQSNQPQVIVSRGAQNGAGEEQERKQQQQLHTQQQAQGDSSSASEQLRSPQEQPAAQQGQGKARPMLFPQLLSEIRNHGNRGQPRQTGMHFCMVLNIRYS